jgi:DNA-binding NtrC family response regulator
MDIHLLFRKFASDFAEKYRMPPLQLTDDAIHLLTEYHWPGNVRQLKKITEQISIIEQDKLIDSETLNMFLPETASPRLPVLYKGENTEHFSDRDLIFKFLFDLKNDMTELKKIVIRILEKGSDDPSLEKSKALLVKHVSEEGHFDLVKQPDADEVKIVSPGPGHPEDKNFHPSEVVEESFSLQDKEKEMIRKSLEKHHGKRKDAARELGISERTLYRKIKEYKIR